MAKAAPVSPLAPKTIPEMPPIEGVRFAAGAAGVRYKGRTDVMLALLDEGRAGRRRVHQVQMPFGAGGLVPRPGSRAARRARCWSIPATPTPSPARAGKAAVKLSAKLAATATGAPERQIFLASTGVIGEPLDASKFEARAAEARDQGAARRMAGRGPRHHDHRHLSESSRRAPRMIDGVEVTIAGFAKGAGHDRAGHGDHAGLRLHRRADRRRRLADAAVALGARARFNAITVDSDTSTSDTLLLFATGAAAARGAPEIEKANDRRLDEFRAALDDVLLDLAHQVVKDGEGARKFVEITVEGAENDRAAKRIALSIANSPLVKTAIAGEDANWGRVVMAVGKAGEKADRDRLAIWFGDIRVAHKGLRDPNYDEAAVSADHEAR